MLETPRIAEFARQCKKNNQRPLFSQKKKTTREIGCSGLLPYRSKSKDNVPDIFRTGQNPQKTKFRTFSVPVKIKKATFRAPSVQVKIQRQRSRLLPYRSKSAWQASGATTGLHATEIIVFQELRNRLCSFVQVPI